MTMKIHITHTKKMNIHQTTSQKLGLLAYASICSPSA
jgi:hypothetical protein